MSCSLQSEKSETKGNSPYVTEAQVGRGAGQSKQTWFVDMAFSFLNCIFLSLEGMQTAPVEEEEKYVNTNEMVERIVSDPFWARWLPHLSLRQ